MHWLHFWQESDMGIHLKGTMRAVTGALVAGVMAVSAGAALSDDVDDESARDAITKECEEAHARFKASMTHWLFGGPASRPQGGPVWPYEWAVLFSAFVEEEHIRKYPHSVTFVLNCLNMFELNRREELVRKNREFLENNREKLARIGQAIMRGDEITRDQIIEDLYGAD